jgi:hypothetical protein
MKWQETMHANETHGPSLAGHFFRVGRATPQPFNHAILL